MVCPASQPQPPPAAGNVNWLNRLRSSRGFPTVDDGLDLGSFLAAQAQSAHDLPKPRAVSLSRGDRRSETVSDILRDLFAMGGGKGGCERVRGKSLRKQRNPRFWGGTEPLKKSSNGGCSSDDLRRGKRSVDGLASSGDISLNLRRKEKSAEELRVEVGEDEEVDLTKFSKSEVTVIDSSVQGWKSEMFVFRKGKNEWKVREKKGKLKSSISVRKKRKLAKPNSSDKDEDDDDAEKRRKKEKKKKTLRVSDSPPRSPPRNGKGNQHAEGELNHEKVDRDAFLPANDAAPMKSLPCSSSHWKLKSGTSSVVLVRPNSMHDKAGTSKPEKSPPRETKICSKGAKVFRQPGM